MTDERTIEVEGYFGKKKQITKEEFIQRWTNHAYDLTNVGVDVVEDVRKGADARFEELWRKDNQS